MTGLSLGAVGKRLKWEWELSAVNRSGENSLEAPGAAIGGSESTGGGLWTLDWEVCWELAAQAGEGSVAV